MRHFIRIFWTIAALSPFMAFGFVGTQANAAVAHSAVTASPAASVARAVADNTNCHNPIEWGNLYGHWYAINGNKNPVIDHNYKISYWCQVPGGSGISFTVYRLEGSSLCATYSGPAAGPGAVLLETCNASVKAQNWRADEYSTGLVILTTAYQLDAGTGSLFACLSSDSAPDSPLIIVNPSGGCNGNGGQTWMQGPQL